MRHLRYVPLLATSIAMGTEGIALRGPPANIRGLREQRSTMNHPSIIFERTASPNSLAFHPPLASDQIRSILVARALVGLLNSPLSSILAKHSQNASIATGSSISHNKTTHGSSNMESYLGSPGVAYPTGLLSEGSHRITSTITANGAEATDNACSSISTGMAPQGTEVMLGRLLRTLRTLGALMFLGVENLIVAAMPVKVNGIALHISPAYEHHLNAMGFLNDSVPSPSRGHLEQRKSLPYLV